MLTAEEKELQKIYGDKVVQVLWMFENDEVAKDGLENGNEVNQFIDDYGDEYGNEIEVAQNHMNNIYKVVHGIGYQILDGQHCVNLEATYQKFLQSQKE